MLVRTGRAALPGHTLQPYPAPKCLTLVGPLPCHTFQRWPAPKYLALVSPARPYLAALPCPEMPCPGRPCQALPPYKKSPDSV